MNQVCFCFMLYLLNILKIMAYFLELCEYF